ncbi:ABC transporter ATP-binding protein [Solidesulfovibrio sp.]|uniref:ABC transporter ATP-binding protein n=1 Tax=Solidesulfovibrio sp. TaxID=2910990 RepID=UPI002B1EB543|nr:ABC transporter ATP-binding protein [Solidesulfovibrio sp.]MEA5089332.1 ABC transporter ATP-binding protein [Solidesulfovibrio sp.]
MIRIQGLCAGYGDADVLGGIDLHIAPGEMVGLLGPNGAGKTTLLLAATGILAPRRGSVRLDGRDAAVLSARQRARLVAAVPQRADNAGELRVRALVLMGRYPYLRFLGGYDEDDETAARAAMEAVGVAHLAARRLGELSGGEFQRVLAARALAQDAKALILDEASAGLDIARKMELYGLLAARNAAGATIVAALHDVNLAALFCNRLIFMKNGNIAADGPVAAVFTSETLSRIYDTDILVVAHPRSGLPQALAVPGPVPARLSHGVPGAGDGLRHR